MQCVSCPPDSLCYGSDADADADANANASCDGASERVIAKFCVPCKVLDRQRRFRSSPSQWDYYGPVSWMILWPVCPISCVQDKRQVVAAPSGRMDFLAVGMVWSGPVELVVWLCSRSCPARETPRSWGRVWMLWLFVSCEEPNGQVRRQVFNCFGLSALLWLSRDEVDSLCEHVIAAEQEVNVNCQERESGNGMAPWGGYNKQSSLRVRLKRETLRQVAEEEQNTGVPSTVLSVMCSVWYAR